MHCISQGFTNSSGLLTEVLLRQIGEFQDQGSIVSLLTGGQDPRKLPKNVLFPIIDRQFKRELLENPYEENSDGKENTAYEDTDKL